MTDTERDALFRELIDDGRYKGKTFKDKSRDERPRLKQELLKELDTLEIDDEYV